MNSSLRSWLVLAFSLPFALAAQAEGPARKARGPAPDAHSILRDERDWPYYVALAAPWKPPGAANALAPGLNAVLIRVEPDHTARVDFGRDGIHRVPIAQTDLVARAARIHAGADAKALPNFTYAITPRLVDAAAEEPRGFALDAFADARAFVCWFADPRASELAALLGALPADPAHVASLFFPQGDVPDLAVRDALRKLEHPMPFALDHLSEPYTRTLTDADTFPRYLVLSANGRWLGEGAWDAQAAGKAFALARRAAAEAP